MRFVITAFLTLAVSANASVNWSEDVRAFARELPKRHLNAFHAISREQFDKEIAAALAKASTASDSEMFLTLSRIAASVGDGHTYAHIPPTARRIPIGVGKFDGGWRVMYATDAYRNVLGTRLVRIGDTPVDEAAKRLTPHIQAVSDAWIEGALPAWLVLGDAMQGLGITASREHIPMVFQRDDGTELAVDLATIGWTEQPAWVFASSKAPLSRLRPPSEPFWFQPVQNDTVYVNWRRYDDLRANARELWSYVDAHHVKKVVIDLRGNGGGDYFKGRDHMINQVKKRPNLKVIALIGPRTYSAAVVNSIDLRNAGATLAGTMIGEKPNGYSENDEFTLPSSKLVVSYSTRLYKFVPDDAPNVVKPDKEIRATWEDFLAGRDPAVEWALSQ